MDGIDQNTASTILNGLADLIFDKWTLVLAGVIWCALRWSMRFVHVSSSARTTAIVRRFLPLLPEVIGVSVSVSGGIPKLNGQPLLVKIGIGLWAAYVSQKMHKILGQTILGDDAKMELAPVKVRPPNGGSDANGA